MMSRSALVVVAACGGSAPPTVRNAAVATTTMPCPKALEELNPLVLAHWGAGAAVDVCVPFVRDGRARWFLEGHADTTGDVPVWNAIVDGSKTVTWHHEVEEAMGFGYMYGTAETADLDGDGNDEVLIERTTGEGGMSMSELVIVYFEPAPVLMSVVLRTGAADDDCDGPWKVVPGPNRAKRIEITRKGKDCSPDDLHELHERRGNSFEKI